MGTCGDCQEMKYVYLVGNEDVEESCVRFVCVTEKKARQRFEELRKGLLKHYEQTRQAAKYRASFPEHYGVLKNITFDNLDSEEMDSLHTLPYWRKVTLDQ